MKKHALTAKRMGNFQPQNSKSIEQPFHPQNIPHPNLKVFSRISIMNRFGESERKEKEKRILELLCLVSIISFVYNFFGNFCVLNTDRRREERHKNYWTLAQCDRLGRSQCRGEKILPSSEREKTRRKRNDELTALCNLITSYYSQLDRCLFLSFFDFLRLHSPSRSPACFCCVRYIVSISFTFFGTFSCGIRSLFHVDVCLIRWRNQTVETRVKKKQVKHKWSLSCIRFSLSVCFFFVRSRCEQNEERERTKTVGTVNALRVAWLINLMAAWLVFDATINILGKYIWFMALSISAPCCARRFVRQNFQQMKKRPKHNQQHWREAGNASMGFVYRKLFLLFVQRVTHWWCRLFIKLNSVCVRLFLWRCDWFWCGFDDALSFVWLKHISRSRSRRVSD